MSEPQTPPRPIEPPTASVRLRRRPSAFLILAILILLAGAAGLGFQQIKTGTERDAARDIAGLRSQVQALDARVAALEKTTGADLESRLGAIEMQLAATEAEMSRAADRDTLAGLQDRVARLETASPGEAMKVAAATLARAGLSRAAQGDTPFKPELEALRAAAPDDPAIAALQTVSETGASTRPALAARFPDAARAALEAERTDGANGNWLSEIWDRAKRLVSVRRIGAVNGMTNEDRLARAQAGLDRGDFAAAVREAGSVTGAAAMALQPWLKDAEARLEVDRTVADMNARIVQALAAPLSAERP